MNSVNTVRGEATSRGNAKNSLEGCKQKNTRSCKKAGGSRHSTEEGEMVNSGDVHALGMKQYWERRETFVC